MGATYLLTIYVPIDLSMVTCLYQIGNAVADSIGDSVAGAVWNQKIPKELAGQGLSATEINRNMASIKYAQDLPDHIIYQNVQYAYGETQKVLNIIGICVSFVTFLFTLGMKPFNVEDRDAEHQEFHQGVEKKHLWRLLSRMITIRPYQCSRKKKRSRKYRIETVEHRQGTSMTSHFS